MKKQNRVIIGLLFLNLIGLHAVVSTVDNSVNSADKVVKNEQPKIEVVNKILCIIYTESEHILITQLDVERKTLDGQIRTLQDLVLEKVLYYEATEYYKIPKPYEAVEKHIDTIEKTHNLSLSEITELFKKEGYSLEQGKQELLRSYAIQNLIQHMIASKVTVTEPEILAFYTQNPIVTPTVLKVQKAVISKDDITPEQIKELENEGNNQNLLNWQMAYTLEEGELADNKKFIASMKPDQIKVIEYGNNYEVIKLLKIKPSGRKTLNESRAEITQHVKMQKYQTLLKEFHNSALKKYKVVYF